MKPSTKAALAVACIAAGACGTGWSIPYMLFASSAYWITVACLSAAAFAFGGWTLRAVGPFYSDLAGKNDELRQAIWGWEEHCSRLEARVAALGAPTVALPDEVVAIVAAVAREAEVIGHAAASVLRASPVLQARLVDMGIHLAKVEEEGDAMRHELAIVDDAHARRKNGRASSMEGEIAAFVGSGRLSPQHVAEEEGGKVAGERRPPELPAAGGDAGGG